jgi:peptide chain release factor 2
MGRRVARLRESVKPWDDLRRRLEDLEVLAELALEEDDSETGAEAESGLASARAELDRLAIESLFTGPFDDGPAIMAITAGAGGTEACDWAEMLLRMYKLWAEHRGYDFQVVSYLEGEGAGLRNTTVRLEGPYAYGYLSAESGVHRLVRLSPFDAAHRRHTSFAAVEVLPEVGEQVDIDIKDDDLRIDTFRSSGAGGQHVNKTDSAVRITHLPTGIVVQCQNERSQHSNKRTAMQILRARLYDLQRRTKQQEMDKLRGDRGEISFANQIRSYVLHPYTMVKDHRTSVQTGDVQSVLDGEIDAFILAWLQEQAAEKAQSLGSGNPQPTEG